MRVAFEQTQGGITTASIVLADDHYIVRQGLRSLLEGEKDLSVIGEAGGGLEAIKLVESLQPDILVVDLKMADMNGIEVARRIAKSSPRTQVVILSMHADESYVLEALQAQVRAYVLKDSTGSQLLHAIREAAAGHRYLSPPLSEKAIEVYARNAEATALQPHEKLSPRERELLGLLTEGYTNTEIAERLCVSRRTVDAHRANLKRKLGMRSQAQLIRYALEHGILPSKR